MDKENKFRKINYSKIKLDPENPRLPGSFRRGRKEEKDLINWMLLEAATVELMYAIGQNGYFIGEQLLVVEDKENPENYIVIEGNRRLTAVKLLNEPELANVKKSAISEVIENTEERPQDIPCLVFEDKSEILKYLGFRHITGIKSWKLLQKASYLYDVYHNEFDDKNFITKCRNIAKNIGSSSNYVRRLITAFNIFKKVEDEGFYSISGLDDTKFHLNYLVDALNKKNIKEHIGVNINSNTPLKDLNQKNLKELIFWWFEKTEGLPRVIGDSDGLKKLDLILGSEKALEAFRDGKSIDDSVELTKDIDSIFRTEIIKSLERLESADNLTHKVEDFYSNLYEDLKMIRKLALKIKEYKDQIEDSKDEF
ncbi:hypothetical protein SAMN05444278_106109 [Psychroflexus salarius]|uniref:ParB-like nuclease domain-containing protein n=1 Tax=Psychroflexus salarius TaxID=1155689 RepID=A0A1M4WQW6_9FLAO|nr:hypothetical protein [Psychroflexus salarius]SHE83382.1 hypothetical protein SAMN05444278_106109 [Psychroflexus salarius]